MEGGDFGKDFYDGVVQWEWGDWSLSDPGIWLGNGFCMKTEGCLEQGFGGLVCVARMRGTGCGGFVWGDGNFFSFCYVVGSLKYKKKHG